jgi:hypothetical protein
MREFSGLHLDWLIPRLLVVVVLSASSSCTPIAAPGHVTVRDDAGAQADGTAASAQPTLSTTDDTDSGAAVSESKGAACTTDGALACDASGSRAVLRCEGGAWVLEETCKATERCEDQPGKDLGRCRPTAAECFGETPGRAFCDGPTRRVCRDLFSADELPCAKQQHCVMVDYEAVCACVLGLVDSGSGCRAATSCSAGACDPASECTMAGAMPSCGACPAGYSGDGTTGCIPELSGLHASCGVFTSALTSGVYQYRLQVPTLCQRVDLTFETAPGVRLRVNQHEAPAALAWSSDILEIGENMLQVSVSSELGLTRNYALVVERHAVETTYIKASNANGSDDFGFFVAASGNTLVAGAPFEDSAAGDVNGDQSNEGAQESGAAYVYVHQGSSWIQQAYLKTDAPASGDCFGAAVAISNDTIVVGAPGHDPQLFGLTPATRAGSAYTFVRRGEVWSLQVKLTPKAPVNGDLFGEPVAIQGDTAFVSAVYDDVGATHSGAVYVFTRNGETWTQRQKLKPAQPIAESAFGGSLAVDGDTLMIGAPLDSSGASESGSVYVFTLRDGMWQEQQRLRAAQPKAGATLGWALAVRDNTAVVSAAGVNLTTTRATTSGEVFLARRNQDDWALGKSLVAQTPRIGDYFGASVALTKHALLIGADADRSGSRGEGGDPSRIDAMGAGAAYLYAQQGDTWVPTAYLKSSNLDPGDSFGQSVAMTDDSVFVGAPMEDSTSHGINGNPSSNDTIDSGAIYVYQ